MRSTWIEVSCTVPEALTDLFADFLVGVSGTGVSIENLSLDTFSLETVDNSPTNTIKAYFPAETSPDEIKALISAFLADHVQQFPGFVFQVPVITTLNEEDWANNWKAYFKPSRVGSHLIIKPTWEPFAGETSDILIEIDPGQAFGTGTHATTRLCLESLEKIFKNMAPFETAADLRIDSVLDVGTGSGVLSIAAGKLGADRICAIDIDPEAVLVAKENLALNGIHGDMTVSTTPLSEIKGTFTIVVANIIAEELVHLANQLFARTEPGGYLILSGILAEKEDFVRNGFGHLRLSPIEGTRRDEWSCLTYRREN